MHTFGSRMHTIGKRTEIERFAFYERAKKAYAVVATGEERQYGNLILVKGVVLSQDAKNENSVSQ